MDGIGGKLMEEKTAVYAMVPWLCGQFPLVMKVLAMKHVRPVIIYILEEYLM